jgi:hypothetical protein
VVNARATAKNLDLLAALNAGRFPGFADGGLVMAPKLTMPAMPGGALMAGSQNVNFAPSINVSVEGGSKGAEADREMGERVSRQVETVMRRIVADELMTQMRPGGMLRS